MSILYGLPALILLVLMFMSAKEKLDGKDEIPIYLRPFYRIVKRMCRFPFLKSKARKEILKLAEKCSGTYIKKKAVTVAENQFYKILSQSLMLVMVGSLLALLATTTEGDPALQKLIRKDTGHGQTVYEIQASIEGESRKIPVVLEERQYTEEEVEKWFDYACENIEELILGKNKSLSEVEEDLNLIESIPDSAVQVSWQCSDYSLIQPSGELCKDRLSKEGDKVKLVATFSYMDYERKHEINLIVKRKIYVGIDRRFQELEEVIKTGEASSRTEESLSLPTEVAGEKIYYSATEDYRELVILMLGVVVALLLPLRERSVAEQSQQKEQRQMFLEYPELVCKLSLYLGAGMNIGKAWEKIALSYINQLSENQRRNLSNDQVLYTYRQLQSGVLTTNAFEEFGNRCGLQLYKKLSLLINSNLRKGSADLSAILQIEAKEAFANRKSELIKLASEASAKLMLPMVLELMVVIGVLIIPAFLTLEV